MKTYALAVRDEAPMTAYADIAEENPEWLWDDRILMHDVSLIVGMRKAGKRFLTCDVAARTSRGWPMPPFDATDVRIDPDSLPLPGSVVMITPEDNPATTVKPTLKAAGADPDKVFCMSTVKRRGVSGNVSRSRFDVQTDVPYLYNAAEYCAKKTRENPNKYAPLRLVVIDPLMASTSKSIAWNLGARAVVEKLQKCASEIGAAIVLVHHFNQGVKLENMQDKVNGSGGLLDAIRVSNVLIKDPSHMSDARIFMTLCTNMSRDAEPIEFIITGEEPYGYVMYKQNQVPTDLASEEQLEQAILALLLDAPRAIQGQELAAYLQLPHDLLRQILQGMMDKGMIETYRRAYTAVAALGAAAPGLVMPPAMPTSPTEPTDPITPPVEALITHSRMSEVL